VILALNTRCIQRWDADHGARDPGRGARGRFLRQRGYGRIVLCGNSGGDSLAAFYQAEGITVTTTPYGVPFDLRPEQLRPVGMAMLAAHPGRAPRARPARHALLALLARVPPCQLAPPRLAPWFSSRHMPNLFRRRIGDLPNLAR
jgi:hypothetical protein